jgi:V/A-type H+-transporting ATPase subunit I
MLTTPLEMKKAGLYMVDADAHAAALALARLAVLHPLEDVSGSEALQDYPAAPYYDVYHDLNSRFGKISGFLKKPLKAPVVSDELVTQDQLQSLDRQLKDLWARISALEEQSRRQNEKVGAIRQLSNSLQKFSSLDLDLGRLRRHGQFLRIVVGTVPAENFGQLRRALSLTQFMIKTFYSSEGSEHVVVFGPSQQRNEVGDLLQSADFRELTVPQEFSGSPAQLQADLDRQIEQAQAQLQQLRHALSELIDDNRATLQSAQALLRQARPYASLATVLRGKGGLVYLQGWVPAHRDDEIRRRLGEQLQFPFQLEFAEPEQQEFDNVPSLLEKSWLLRPFQGLVKNFGMPGYREVDPSGLFALSYILMFGMMFGDIGHGAVIALASLFFLRRFPGVTIVGVLAGLSSMLFGWVYGSLFGYEHVVPPLWMSPMHDPVQVLLLAVLWGAGFIVIANLLAIRNFLAVGQLEQALYSGKGVAGLVFYLAAFHAAYQVAFNGRFGLLESITVMAPLAVIVGFQWRQSSGGLVERILVVFIEGLEHIISNVSGTLSFLRVAAFSLNHIALAAAVFAIAGMLDSFGHGVTVLLGNLFIIVLEGAIVAIQCLRLEYYEGFSRFFSGKGRAFEPLKFET